MHPCSTPDISSIALEHLPTPVLVVDRNNTLLVVNARAEAFFGCTGADLVGESLDRFILSVPGSADTTGNWKATAVRRGGERIPVEVRAAGLPDGRGSVVAVHDMRRMHIIEDELRMARVAGNVARMARSEFFVQTTHALKTPLHAILGFSDILNSPDAGVTDETHRRFIAHIHDNSRRLLKLLDDLLDLARAESGLGGARRETVDVRDLIERLLSLACDFARRSDITVQADIDPEVPHVDADRSRLKTAIFNVLENAVRSAGTGGSVTVRAGRYGDDGVFICISDAGRDSKPAGELRGSGGLYCRTYHGTELTMLLASRFVELHGGSLWFESDDAGCNTTVTMTIPIAGGSTPAEEETL